MKKTRLTIETLEDRTVPSAMAGMAWPSTNLTLSFVPDGTNVEGNQSTLFQTMNSQAATRVWQTAILQAAQTWADAGNINIGLVADGGEPLGAPGLIEGDPRFGDIRVAAVPMGPTAQLSIGTPYDPAAGTLSGDIVFNSSLSWGTGRSTSYDDIYTAALHELGNALGMTENNDPTSAMCQTYQGPVTGLSPSDIAAFQSLYGPRDSDGNNNTLSTGAAMTWPVIAGNLGAVGQANYYQYTVPTDANQTITVSVKNGGISLLEPSLSVYDASGDLIATSSATDPFSNNVSITLSNVTPGMTLYFAVSGASNDVFGMGAYQLSVDSGPVSELQIAALSPALNSTNIQYANFGNSNSTIATAVSLDQPAYQIDPSFNYAVDAQLNGAASVNFFSIVTPANAPQALLFTAAPGQGSQLSSELTVYDANGNVVDAQILSADAGGYVVQVPNPVADATYYLAVSPNPLAASINDPGTYRLGVNYAPAPIVPQTIANDSLSATEPVAIVSVESTEVQLYQFVLSVDSGIPDSGISVEMQLFDANGNLVTSLLCLDGQTVSADVLLMQSNYTILITAVDQNGVPLPATSYSLTGICLSNPLDPVPVNPTDPSLNSGTGTGTGTTPSSIDTSTLLVTDPTSPPVLPPLPHVT